MGGPGPSSRATSMKVAGTLSFSSWVFSARPEEEEEPVRDQLQSSTEGEQMGVTAGRLLTQVGVHDKEVEVLLQVTAVLRHLSPQQVEYGSQQVVAQTEVVAALRATQRLSHTLRSDSMVRLEAGQTPYLCRGSGRGGGRRAGPVLQREVGDEDDELGEGAAHLGARALQQVLGEAVGVRKQDVVCKPIANILTVSQQDAEGVIPAERDRERKYLERRFKSDNCPLRETDLAYQSLAGPRTSFLVWKPVLKRNLAAS